MFPFLYNFLFFSRINNCLVYYFICVFYLCICIFLNAVTYLLNNQKITFPKVKFSKLNSSIFPSLKISLPWLDLLLKYGLAIQHCCTAVIRSMLSVTLGNFLSLLNPLFPVSQVFLFLHLFHYFCGADFLIIYQERIYIRGKIFQPLYIRNNWYCFWVECFRLEMI